MTRRATAVNAREGAVPVYELRAQAHGAGDLELEVWQLPTPATPHLESARRIAGLRGRNLSLVEHRLLRQLKQAGIDPLGMRKGDHRAFDLDEDAALRFGLLFRVLAPMRRRQNIGSCVVGIEAMGKEEAAYWLGMAMHRKYPRRVLTALRVLLVDPKAS